MFAPLIVGVALLAAPPNIVIVYVDDMGYGDLSCYGQTRWKTPRLDRMAREGVRFTDFHVAQPVCSASRTALLTGCYPNRLGIHGALGPKDRHGIADSETTLGQLLQKQGYATACFGKWHLGHLPPFLPTRHGFDQYFGLPYSNDMWPNHPEAKKGAYPPLPLIEQDRVVATMPDQNQLTRWYTERAVGFIRANKERPFFLYVPHAMPHVPLHVGEKFRGKSGAGLYGDVAMELDWSVGEILDAIAQAGVEKNTFVLFASDNGPWLSYGDHAGGAGPLREGKGTCWEGGVRVPCIARWPGRIPAGSTCREPAMTIDVLPTVAKLVGAPLPPKPIDGLDVWPLFACDPGAKNPHDAYYFYFNVNELQAVRSGRWKLILPHAYRTLPNGQGGVGGKPVKYRNVKAGTELYDLEADPGEKHDVAAANPAVVQKLQEYVERARADLGDSLVDRKGAGTRGPGRVAAKAP